MHVYIKNISVNLIPTRFEIMEAEPKDIFEEVAPITSTRTTGRVAIGDEFTIEE